MAKNQSLPAHLQEKDSRGEENLTLYEHYEKPTIWWPRPSLSNPRSTNDIVWAFYVRPQTVTVRYEIVSLQKLYMKLFYILMMKTIHETVLYIKKYERNTII